MKNLLFTYRNQIAASAVALIAIGATFAAPPSTPFYPNETLNPSCAPWSPNCYVQPIDTDTDQQTLALSGSTLSIVRGNSINIPSSADNLGNHTATANIKLNNYWLSNDGDSEGVYVSTAGNVWIGTSSPTNPLSITSGTIAGGNAGQLSIKTTNGNPAYVGIQGNNWNVLGLWGPGISLNSPPDLGVSGSVVLLNVPISEYGQSIRFNPRWDIGVSPWVLITSGGVGVKTFAIRAYTAQTADLQQWQNSAGAALSVISSAWNFGIGTTAPGSKLDISDTTGGSNYLIGRFTGAGGSVQIVGNDGSARTALISQALHGNTGSLGTLTLQSTDGNSNHAKVVVGANGGFDLQFDVPSSTVATTAMYIKNTSGNVGIGTTTPVAKLDVAGNIKVANSSATCGASNAGEIRYNTATSKHEGCNGTAWNDLY